LRKDGALIIDDIFGQKLIQEAREAFFQRHHRYLDGHKHPDALQVGDGRAIAIDLEPPFEAWTWRESMASSFVRCYV
jgi:hypothetical protein